MFTWFAMRNRRNTITIAMNNCVKLVSVVLIITKFYYFNLFSLGSLSQ